MAQHDYRKESPGKLRKNVLLQAEQLKNMHNAVNNKVRFVFKIS